MFELSRVRLHSVGPKGARYRDVTLDFRDAGQILPGRGRRPSPATVLFLENGGGKTVLMRLIFSVMQPGRRNVLGSSSNRGLEDYVLAQDAAHVILEWRHTKTGDLVVTAKASEWRGHAVSSDPGRLSELWYTFRPTAAFNVDSLPLVADGRLVTLAGFRDQLSKAVQTEPALQAAHETNHKEWLSKLDNLGLDAELFRYQRAMNAGEGEAADAFTFKSDQAFVEFLLRAVTDEDDTGGLAEVIHGYADQLARRTDLVAERDFVAGALERLTPLRHAAQEATAAHELAGEARRESEALAATLATRLRDDAATLAHAETQLEEIRKTENIADRKQDRLGAVVLELRRLVAGLELDAAEATQTELERQRDHARHLVKAWQAAELELAWRRAGAEVTSVQDLVKQQTAQALPALRQRDRAATAFAAALSRTASLAEREAHEANSKAGEHDTAAGKADNEAHDAIARREKAAAELGAAQRSTAQLNAKLHAAVTAGILTDTGRVTQESNAAQEEAVQLRDSLDDAWSELNRLDGERSLHSRENSAAQAKLRTAQQHADQLSQKLTAATAATAALAAEPRLAEIAAADAIDLEADAQTLLEGLGEAVTHAENERAALHLAAKTSERVMQALGTGSLLPPSPSAEQALAILEQHGITAWSGWRYLAEIPPGPGRSKLIRAYPHLVDGIVLNNPSHLPQAQQLLDEAKLLPAMVIAVGTTADLQNPDVASPTGMAFLVEPNPALYDVEAAARERQTLLAQKDARDARLRFLDTQIEHDRELARQVRTWRTDFPPGAFAELTESTELAETTAATEAAAAQAAGTALEKAVEAENLYRQMLPGLERSVREATERAGKLEALAADAQRLPEWAEQARTSAEYIKEAERNLSEAKQKAGYRRQEAASARNRAGDKLRIQQAAIEEIGTVVGATGQTHSLVPQESVAELRAHYQACSHAYAKVEVGEDLLATLRTAQEKQSTAYATWQSQPTDVRDSAAELLATSDGADTAARSAARTRAEKDTERLDGQIVDAAGAVGALRNEYNSYVRQERSLEPYGKPSDIPHGKELISQASADQAEAKSVLDTISAARKDLEDGTENIRETVREFQILADSFDTLTTQPALDVVPFPGDVKAARAKRKDTQAALTEAERLRADADQAERAAADRLTHYAADVAFEKVQSPVRRQIVMVEREQMPRYAAEWETALLPRLRSLTDELAQINEHRGAIVSRLQGMVDASLSILRTAQRLSKLPPGMEDWSGQEFLRIKFTELEPTVLRERLGQVIDEEVSVVDKPKSRGKDGTAILLRAVQASMPKGVVVEILKPDAVLRTERVRVSSIGDVFSGGQLLTAAIILYCTLAALRANDRGQTGHRHSGVLFLDNPIGRASAGYLLELQLAVAKALGVQLIYTTGLFDTNALAVFPLVVRLRNDADIRAGLKYLSVDSQIRQPLDELGHPDGTGRLTSTRIFVRPRDAE